MGSNYSSRGRSKELGKFKPRFDREFLQGGTSDKRWCRLHGARWLWFGHLGVATCPNGWYERDFPHHSSIGLWVSSKWINLGRIRNFSQVDVDRFSHVGGGMLVGMLLDKMEKTLFLGCTLHMRRFEDGNDEGEGEEMRSAVFIDHFLYRSCTNWKYCSCENLLKWASGLNASIFPKARERREIWMIGNSPFRCQVANISRLTDSDSGREWEFSSLIWHDTASHCGIRIQFIKPVNALFPLPRE